MLPGAVLWGASFPLALASVVSNDDDPARLVGGVYAANTLGAIAGSLGASLLLVVWLGSQRAQQLMIGFAAASAVILFWQERVRPVLFGVAGVVWWLDRKYRFGRGRAFALYVMLYSLGRFWVELLRTDDAEVFGGMRLNNWTAIVVFLGALIYFMRVRGPREYLAVEDGKIIVVPPPGTRASAGLVKKNGGSRSGSWPISRAWAA